MEIKLNGKNSHNVSVGDLIVLPDGETRYLVEDEGEYFFVNLANGVVTSCMYNDLDELLSYYDIVRVIPANKLVVSEK